VSGGELFERIKSGHGTSDEFARRYFKQLLSGIAYCHEKGE
jgi:serine/threonine protein kinase